VIRAVHRRSDAIYVDLNHGYRNAVFVDLNRDYRKSILIASSGRSGSTWLVDIVNYANEYRIVFEPLRRDRSALAAGIPFGLYLEPHHRATPPGAAISAILAGRSWTGWSNQQNRKHVAARRIVKEIRATNLTPWIRVHFPELPIVYLLRHPIAVARSWTRLGWPDFLSEFIRQEALMRRLEPFRPMIDEILAAGGTLERHVLRWCLENYIPLRDLGPTDTHVVFYEHLTAQPEAEVRRLFGYIRRPFDPRALGSLETPSALAYPDSPLPPLPRGEGARALEIVAAFGLDRVYGPDPPPLLPAGASFPLLPR
jgi:hypothetical protein